MVVLVILFFVTLIVFLLPFIPVIYEWKNKTDAEPLNTKFQDRTIIDYCLQQFRDFLHFNFAGLIDQYKQENSFYEGRHADGMEFFITGKAGPVELSPAEIKHQKSTKVIITCQPAILPDDMQFDQKIYAVKAIETGKNNNILELLAESEIKLDKNSKIQKFIWSGSSIKIEQNCALQGYAKAAIGINFENSAKFQCLYAPQIAFGEIEKNVLEKIPLKASDVFTGDIIRTITKENLTMPEASHVRGHQVVKGNLTIRDHSTITGNIKCYGDVRIGHGVHIIGSMICEKDIYIADDCVIQGPVVSDGMITIGKNCIVGTTDTPTSFIGKKIQVGTGTIFSGLVLARIEGNYKA